MTGRVPSPEECPCPAMYRDVAYCPDCPLRSGRVLSAPLVCSYRYQAGIACSHYVVKTDSGVLCEAHLFRLLRTTPARTPS